MIILEGLRHEITYCNYYFTYRYFIGRKQH